MDKIKSLMYYILIGVISFITLTFLPLIGSQANLGWNLPNTITGWIVWGATKAIVATINVLIFHCFMMQGKLNCKNNEYYLEAREILRKNHVKNVQPQSPAKWLLKQYGQKGTTIFITTGLSTIALTQAILTFDYMSMLTYLFTITMGLIFGVLQMKTAEEYWSDEYWRYAKGVQEEAERRKSNDN